jgi:hypothetical protein
MSDLGMRHIVLSDWGYRVQFTQGTKPNMKMVSYKTFGYAAYDYDVDKMLKDAIKHRDSEAQRLGLGTSDFHLKNRHYSKPTKSSSTGFIGITHRTGRGEGYRNFWVASWREDGQQCSKSFSYDLDENDKEFQKKRAIRHRKKMVALHSVGAVDKPPRGSKK